MSERQPYSRVYWSIRTDAKFDAIYTDDRHLATWLRLLIAADATWPAPADVPASARKASLTALVDARLIDLLPGGLFKVHGLDAERGRRRDAAQTSALIRHGRDADADRTDPQTQSERRPNGVLAEDKPSQAEDETSRADAPRVPDPADAYWTLTGKYPNDKALSWIDDMASSYGPEPVLRAIAQAHVSDRSTASLLGRAQDLLRADARALSLKDQAAVRANLKERRAEPRTEVDPDALRAEIQRLMQPGAAA